MLKIKAVKNDSTLNPPTIFEHNKIITALMTNRNKPNENIVAGNVNRINMGFTNTLSKPKTTATIKAVSKLATFTLGIKCAISITKADVIKILVSSFIYFFISKVKDLF
jgi:uncharacterized membrane protein YoaK (UPF0700 family)